MKKLFAGIFVALVFGLFGTVQCANAETTKGDDGRSIWYDESSINVIRGDTTAFEFNVNEDDGAGVYVAKYRFTFGHDSFLSNSYLYQNEYRPYGFWKSAKSNVFRRAWKLAYGYGFS